MKGVGMEQKSSNGRLPESEESVAWRLCLCAGPWGVVNLPARHALVPSPGAPAPPPLPPALPGSPICTEGSVLPGLTGLAENRHRLCKALVNPGILSFRSGYWFL